MLAAILISTFFGLVAAFALASCAGSISLGFARWRAIRAELAAMDRAPATVPVRLRRPQEAFALLAG